MSTSTTPTIANAPAWLLELHGVTFTPREEKSVELGKIALCKTEGCRNETGIGAAGFCHACKRRRAKERKAATAGIFTEERRARISAAVKATHAKKRGVQS